MNNKFAVLNEKKHLPPAEFDAAVADILEEKMKALKPPVAEKEAKKPAAKKTTKTKKS